MSAIWGWQVVEWTRERSVGEKEMQFAESTRRQFIRNALYSSLFASPLLAESVAAASVKDSFSGDEVFRRILNRAKAEKWESLSIGELMGKIAKELEGTPYVGGTLDRSPEVEKCTISMTELDCVTFFETTLGFARMIKKGGSSPEDLLKEVRFTRYRGGKQGDYSSRLHYTTDWFFDNQQKGVVKILSDLPGAEPFTQKVGIMTSHPEFYKAIGAHPELSGKLKRIEQRINAREFKYVPMAKLAGVESLLKTGDIVGVCTSQSGIDIAHTGIVWRDAADVPHFMDASSGKSKMKVTIEPGPISQALNWSKNLTGAIFARPIEPIRG